MAFWWVFQGDSYKRAKEGAYLWAPQQNRTGHRLFHWTNMTQVQTGDVIFSGYQQKVVAVSVASGTAYESDPPDERDVPKWPSRGWRIDVVFSELKTALYYRDFVPLIVSVTRAAFAILKDRKKQLGLFVCATRRCRAV